MKNPITEGYLMSRGLLACVDLIRHPERLERVHDITNWLARKYPNGLSSVRELFARDPQGAAALKEKPRLRVDLDELSRLAPGTLGRTFADHMRANNLDATALPEVGSRVRRPTIANGEELRFIRAHIYDTHDVWHVVTGFGADVAGELGLQAFCAAQTPYPLPTLLLGLGLLNTAVIGLADSARRMEAVSQGWRMGKEARPLFGMRWDQRWGEPLEEVRRSLGVRPFQEATLAAA